MQSDTLHFREKLELQVSGAAGTTARDHAGQQRARPSIAQIAQPHSQARRCTIGTRNTKPHHPRSVFAGLPAESEVQELRTSYMYNFAMLKQLWWEERGEMRTKAAMDAWQFPLLLRTYGIEYPTSVPSCIACKEQTLVGVSVHCAGCNC